MNKSKNRRTKRAYKLLTQRGFLFTILLCIVMTASHAWGGEGWIEVWDHGMLDANHAYNKWFERLNETDEAIDVVVVVRVRAFGKRSDMIRTWNKSWGAKFPQWDWWKKSGCYVPSGKSTDIPEVWMELRQDKNGNLVFPMHTLGHEVMHAIQTKDHRASNPDNFTKTVFEYKPGNSSQNAKIAASEKNNSK